MQWVRDYLKWIFSGIGVLNEKVFLPIPYINYYVLAEWNLKEEQLHIHFEKEQQPELIKKLLFKINPRPKEKLRKLLKI